MTATHSVSSSPDPQWPAPRGRTLILMAGTFGLSLLLAGWIGSGDEEVVVGTLSAQTATVHPSLNGRLQEWLVRPGENVEMGTPLAVITDVNLTQKVAAARQRVINLETEYKRREATAEVDLAWRLRTVEAEILRNRLKTAELLQREYDHKVEQQAWKNLLKENRLRIRTASPDQVFRTVSAINPDLDDEGDVGWSGWNRLSAMKGHETARNAAEVAKVQLLLCEDRLRELEKFKRELPEKIRKAAGVDVTAAELKAARQELKELESRSEQQTLTSSAYGRIQKLTAQPGDRVTPADEMTRILDDEHRFLSVPVPAGKLARFEQGAVMTLRFPGDKRRTGKIVAIQNSAADNPETVTVLIEPTGQLWPKIPLGSAVSVILPQN